MRIQLISDLHLERYPEFTPRAAPDVDVLVLAGDIGSYGPGSLLEGDDFGLARFSPLSPDAKWRRVLYLPGNHEFDSLDYDQTYSRLRSLCHALGIDWLERETVYIDGIRFLGTTLWSDFEALAKREDSVKKRGVALNKAYRAADRYLRTNTTLRGGESMLAEDIRLLGLDCQQWLAQALRSQFDGTTVVVTHFAPSLKSADPRYGLTPGTAGFCNALDDLLSLADVWMHGHLHCPQDYLVSSPGDDPSPQCRVVANPRGYHDNGEHEGFKELFVLEV